MKNTFKLLAISAAIGFSGSVWADAQEEVNKQIAKLIGDAVSTRVSSTTAPAPGAQLPNNAWGSYSRLTVDPEGSSSIGTDILVGGYDRDLSKDWVAGVALSYNRSNKFSADGWSLSPYVAYRFNEAIFGVVRAGYSEFDARGVNGDSMSVAGSVNGIHRFGNAYGQWRAEIGFSDTDMRATGGTNTQSTATSYIGDGELGYYFADGFKGFAGLQLSDTNRQNSYNAFVRFGLEKDLSKTAAISAKYERKVDDNSPSNGGYDIDVFTIAARFRF